MIILSWYCYSDDIYLNTAINKMYFINSNQEKRNKMRNEV